MAEYFNRRGMRVGRDLFSNPHFSEEKVREFLGAGRADTPGYMLMFMDQLTEIDTYFIGDPK